MKATIRAYDSQVDFADAAVTGTRRNDPASAAGAGYEPGCREARAETGGGGRVAAALKMPEPCPDTIAPTARGNAGKTPKTGKYMRGPASFLQVNQPGML